MFEEGDLEEREYPDEDDDSSEGESSDMVIECSACGREVYEDSPRCPHCGEWFPARGSRSTAGRRRRLFIWITAVVCILLLVFIILGI